jgi:hypothetical protein
MLFLYRCLLFLYPSSHRDEFGEEMIAVFREVHSEVRWKGIVERSFFCAREVAGLLIGALEERFRSITGVHPGSLFPSRRFSMRSEFRFPKATAVLMTIILAGVVLAIERAEAISASLPRNNPPVGPIQPAHFTFLPTVALMLAAVYAAGALGWAILFALRRSGVHRLSAMEGVAQKP